METQKVTIEIASSTIAMLQARAEAQGITPDELLLILAGAPDGSVGRAFVEMTPEERVKAFEEWIANHSVKSTIADDGR